MASRVLQQPSHRTRNDPRRGPLPARDDPGPWLLDVVGGLASTGTIPITAHALPVPLLAAFVVNESRARQPIMPLRLFASAERVGAYAGRIPVPRRMMGFWFSVTQYPQNRQGLQSARRRHRLLPDDRGRRRCRHPEADQPVRHRPAARYWPRHHRHRHVRTIWVVRHGDDLYVRSVNGPTARLVPRHPRSAEGQVQAGSVTRDVTFVDVDDALNDDVDTAYRTKYRRHAENTLNRVTRPQARAITMN